jgi:hypothetical protein
VLNRFVVRQVRAFRFTQAGLRFLALAFMFLFARLGFCGQLLPFFMSFFPVLLMKLFRFFFMVFPMKFLGFLFVEVRAAH